VRLSFLTINYEDLLPSGEKQTLKYVTPNLQVNLQGLTSSLWKDNYLTNSPRIFLTSRRGPNSAVFQLNWWNIGQFVEAVDTEQKLGYRLTDTLHIGLD